MVLFSLCERHWTAQRFVTIFVTTSSLSSLQTIEGDVLKFGDELEYLVTSPPVEMWLPLLKRALRDIETWDSQLLRNCLR